MSFEDDRSKFLATAIDAMLEHHAAYMESDNECFGPDDSLWDRIDEVIAVFADGTIPGDMRRASAIIERELSPAWEKYIDERERSLDPIHFLPGNGLWSAIRSLRDERQRAATKAITRRPEPVAELVESKVPMRQIALIWGWALPDGSPDLEKVREEIATPGIHTSKWVDPNVAKQQAERDRQKQIAERIESQERAKIAKSTAKPPESIETLIGQGVSATQIAKMHHCTINDVFAEADRLGLPRPPENYTGAQHSRTAFEPEFTPEQAASVRRTTGDAPETVAKKRGRPKKVAPVEPAAVEMIDDQEEEWETGPEAPVDPMAVKAQQLFNASVSIDEIAAQLGVDSDRVEQLLESSTAG